jgi:hypothetical protein
MEFLGVFLDMSRATSLPSFSDSNDGSSTGELMASEMYGKYVIVSRPDYQPQAERWSLYCLVMWQEGEDLRSHHFRTDRTFDTENEAELLGLAECRAWIDAQA